MITLHYTVRRGVVDMKCRSKLVGKSCPLVAVRRLGTWEVELTWHLRFPVMKVASTSKESSIEESL